jgi:hypothetical protein
MFVQYRLYGSVRHSNQYFHRLRMLVSETGLRNSQVLHQLIFDLIETIRKTPKSVSLRLLKRHEDVSNSPPFWANLKLRNHLLLWHTFLLRPVLSVRFRNRLMKRTTPWRNLRFGIWCFPFFFFLFPSFVPSLLRLNPPHYRGEGVGDLRRKIT